MKRSYLSSEETIVDQQRMKFLIERCGSKPGHTHQDLANSEQGEIIGSLGLPTTTILNQSGDLQHTCDDHITPPAAPGESKLTKNVVSTREEHNQLQLEDDRSTNSIPTSPPCMGNYVSLSQGYGEEPGGAGVSLCDSSCQHFDKEQYHIQPEIDSPSRLVNHDSLGQGAWGRSYHIKLQLPSLRIFRRCGCVFISFRDWL